MFKRCLSFTLVVFAACLLLSATARAQGTASTYQGKLTDAGNPASGQYDFQFKLYDSLSGGAQQGSTVSVSGTRLMA